MINFPHEIIYKNTRNAYARINRDGIVIFTNPPYGKRLNVNDDLSPLYEKLADYLKECYGGVISSYPGMRKLFNSKHFSHKQVI